MEIKSFHNPTFGSLTTVISETTGTIMFLGKEVAALFGHTNLTQAIKTAKLSVDEYKVVDLKRFAEFKEQLTKLDLVGQRASYVTFISESGLYKLALASSKAEAGKFRDWVTQEVLPSIIRTGKYELPQLTVKVLAEQTNRQIQLSNSKAVNTKNFEKGVPAIIEYNVDNCKQVSGLTPAQIKKASGKKSKSAKEILRETHPELAATMSLNDLFVAKGVPLGQLKALDKSVVETFKEILKIGIQITE